MREEEQIKLALGRKNGDIFNAQTELNEIHEELKELQSTQKEGRESCRDVTELRYSVTYRNKLKLDIIHKGQQIYEYQKELAHIRQRLVQAKQKRRAIELLKEKQYAAWQKEAQKQENVFLDELSQTAFIRKKRQKQKSSHSSEVT